MSLVPCETQGCPARVREGLVRAGRKGQDGAKLADGRRCWRCRRGTTAHIKRGRIDPRPPGARCPRHDVRLTAQGYCGIVENGEPCPGTGPMEATP